jgi:hypothetical protein
MSINNYDLSRGGFLAGKKTYITAITGILTAVGAYYRMGPGRWPQAPRSGEGPT